MPRCSRAGGMAEKRSFLPSTVRSEREDRSPHERSVTFFACRVSAVSVKFFPQERTVRFVAR